MSQSVTESVGTLANLTDGTLVSDDALEDFTDKDGDDDEDKDEYEHDEHDEDDEHDEHEEYE